MYQPLIKFHPHPAIFTQVLRIFDRLNTTSVNFIDKDKEL